MDFKAMQSARLSAQQMLAKILEKLKQAWKMHLFIALRNLSKAYLYNRYLKVVIS